MITVQSESLLQCAKAAFLALYNGRANESDSAIYREDAAVLELPYPGLDDQPFELRGTSLRYLSDYRRYLPFATEDHAKLEEAYFTSAFITTGKLELVASGLQRKPDSRRAVVSVWESSHMNAPRSSAPCVTQLYFRLRSGRLEVHSHSRANDAYRLLLPDMQFARWCQDEIAKRMSVPVGRYLHFVDSLQLYVRHLEEIEKQRVFVLTSPIWSERGFRK